MKRAFISGEPWDACVWRDCNKLTSSSDNRMFPPSELGSEYTGAKEKAVGNKVCMFRGGSLLGSRHKEKSFVFHIFIVIWVFKTEYGVTPSHPTSLSAKIYFFWLPSQELRVSKFRCFTSRDARGVAWGTRRWEPNTSKSGSPRLLKAGHAGRRRDERNLYVVIQTNTSI